MIWYSDYIHVSLRLLAVPHDGHAREEIERSEQNGKKQEPDGKLAGEEAGKEEGTAFPFEPDVFG